ncbi:hypothetical protein GCM10028801_41440 [Nocardioides maradonensis]
MRTPIALGATALLALTVTACGSNNDTTNGASVPSPATSTSATSSASSDSAQPSCAEVWAVGKVLPAGYKGCLDGDTLVDVGSTDCTDGSSMYIHQDATGKDQFIAITGQPIKKYSAAADSATYTTCRA